MKHKGRQRKKKPQREKVTRRKAETRNLKKARRVRKVKATVVMMVPKLSKLELPRQFKNLMISMRTFQLTGPIEMSKTTTNKSTMSKWLSKR